MESPVTTIRNKLGLTKTELANGANISAPTLEYIENGAYGNLPGRLSQILSVVDREINSHYNEWKLKKRLDWKGPLSLDPSWPTLNDFMHPHQEWRQINCELSITHYAEALCVPRISIQNLENNKTKSFPQDLKIALTMACGSTVTQQIIKACKGWNRQRSR